MHCEDCQNGITCEACLKEYTEDDLKKLIDKGMKNNIIVYDSDASVGELTVRLFLLIGQYLKRNGELPTEFIISNESYSLNHAQAIYENFELKSIFGVKVTETALLEYGSETHKYYNNQLSTFDNQRDKQIVLAKTNNNVYLASY